MSDPSSSDDRASSTGEPGAGGASVLYATGDVEQGVVLDALAEKGHLFVL